MSTLERAIVIAAQAHAGQLDKAGAPYILHPLRVMLRMQDAEARIAAVLHDVVEDSAWTLEALAAEGFGVAVLRAVDALTKRPGEDRYDAARRAAQDPLARTVKLAEPTAKDYARLAQYQEIRDILEPGG